MFADNSEPSSINLEELNIKNIPRPVLKRSVASNFSPSELGLTAKYNDTSSFDKYFKNITSNKGVNLLNEKIIKDTIDRK